MFSIKTNTEYKAAKFRSGVSEKGPWELIIVERIKENGSKDRMHIWVMNTPCNVVEGAKFIIDVIDSASMKRVPPREGYDKWSTEFSINAIVSPVEE